MGRFTNHIDHVAWISRLENIEANVAKLERLADAKLERFVFKEMGFVMYVSWEAGLEVVAPTTEPTEFNQALRERLETRERVWPPWCTVSGTSKRARRAWSAWGLPPAP